MGVKEINGAIFTSRSTLSLLREGENHKRNVEPADPVSSMALRTRKSSTVEFPDNWRVTPRRNSKSSTNPCKLHSLFNLGSFGDEQEPESAPASRTDLDAIDAEIDASTQLMNKDSLSQLVLNVRDLSKSLSNLSMKLRMRNILIVSKIYDSLVIPATREMALWLLEIESDWGKLNVYVQDIMKDLPGFEYDKMTKDKTHDLLRLKFWSEQYCSVNPNKFDLVITLGGDGTVLFASWMFQTVVPPVVSFNMGSLGFLTDFDFNDRQEIISDIINNGVSCSLRMRFECTIMKSVHETKSQHLRNLNDEMMEAERLGEFKRHRALDNFCILNDVVVDRGPNPTMTTTELYGDFKYLTVIEADGVVISTPSGSTAYSLSAGGSLVHPDIPGILVSPICPHTLSFRPLVLPDSLIIRVGVPYDARASAWCSFDGRSRIELEPGDFLSVSASRFPFPKVQNGNTSIKWFSGLSKTLHWNERKRQKALI